MPEQNGLAPLTVDNFAGGITSHPIGGAVSRQEENDNQVINISGDIETRPGCREKYEARLNDTYSPGAIIDHDTNILIQCGPKVHYFSSEVKTVTSPGSNDVFPSATNSSKVSSSFWNGHTLAASDSFDTPQKIYELEDGTFTTENLGVPEILYASCITLANELKAKYNAHIDDDTEHGVTKDITNVVTADDADSVATLIALVIDLMEQYEAHEGDAETGSPQAYHSSPEASDHSLTSTTEPISLFTCYERLKDLKSKYNAHDADSTAHTTGSQHQVTAAVEPSGTAGASGTESFIYGLCFTYRYEVDGKEFLEQGRIHSLQVETTKAPDDTKITLSDIPELVSGDLQNWNDDEIKIRLFRTTNGGANLYFLDEIDNGTTSYEDTTADSSLTNNEPAYTEGGVLQNDMPPPAKFISTVGSTTYYANVKIGATVYGNRFMWSKVAQPGAVPEENFKDFESDITGTAQSGIYPIVFLKNKCYRIEGTTDSFGQGVVRERSISQSVGCVSNKSIVTTEEGVFFAAEDGFYFSDGFGVTKVSTELDPKYAALANKSNINATVHKTQEWVLWGVQADDTSAGNDTIWCCHLKHPKRDLGFAFSTWSGGLDADNFSVSALNFIDGVLYRADRRGYLLYHDADFRSDAYVDTEKTPDNWWTQTIHWTVTTIAHDFNNAQVRKWVPKLNVNCDNVSTLHLKVESHNDNSGAFFEMKAIEDNNRIAWGDDSILWGQPNIRWDYQAVISQWRHFPTSGGTSIRCMYKQLRFTNDYTTIVTSDALGTATVTANTQSVALDDFGTKDWVSDVVNYFISFADDDYTQEWLIVDNDGAGNLTLLDTNNQLSDLTSTEWRIRGYKKDESFNLLNYVLNFRELTQTQSAYSAFEAA